MTKYLVAVLLTLSFFSAKPMEQGFRILEQTAEYIAAEGPAMIAEAGAIIAYMDERAENYFPLPEQEEVYNDSNGIETNDMGHAAMRVLEVARDGRLYDPRRETRSSGCIIS